MGVEALPYADVEADTAQQLLAIGGVTAVAVGDEGVRRLLLQAPTLLLPFSAGPGRWLRVL